MNDRTVQHSPNGGRTNNAVLYGDLGPAQVGLLRCTLDQLLTQPRPLIEVDLSEVTSVHLGVINVLIAARDQARARLGDVSIIVSADSDASRMLARVGLVRTMRP